MHRQLNALLLHRETGFTLVELVAVLIVLGILGGGVISFIGDSTNGFAATTARAQLAEDAQYLVEKFSDEIREALPNSVRANAQCLEFVPIKGGSKYQTLPIGNPADGFYSWPIDPPPSDPGLRAAVYPQADLYSLANPGSVSTELTIGLPELDNRVRLSFGSQFAFLTGAPRANYFLISSPVSYCTTAGRLYRYTDYGFIPSQPNVASLPTSLPNRALAGEGISATFSVAPATLVANSIVAMDIEVSARGETVQLNHLAHVRNAP